MIQIPLNFVFPNAFYGAKIDGDADLIRDTANPEHHFIGVTVQIFAFTLIGVQMVSGIKGKLFAHEHAAVMIFELIKLNVSFEFLKSVDNGEFTGHRAHDCTCSLRYLLRKVSMPALLSLQAGHSPQPSPIMPL
ncbi:hypothetical protein D3C78_1440630 [compost metagenome]